MTKIKKKCVTTSSLYTNRANMHVLNRMLDFGKKKLDLWCTQDISILKTKQKKLEHELTILQNNEQSKQYNTSHVTSCFSLQRQIRNIKKNILLSNHSKILKFLSY